MPQVGHFGLGYPARYLVAVRRADRIFLGPVWQRLTPSRSRWGLASTTQPSAEVIRTTVGRRRCLSGLQVVFFLVREFL